MNLATFKISFEKAIDFIKYADLFKMKGIKDLGSVSDEFKKVSLSKPYYQVYTTGKRNFDFDILLKDDSFFQFSLLESKEKTHPQIRYSFFQNPQDFLTYDEYLEEVVEDNSEDVKVTFHDLYEQFLLEQELKSNFVTIRFDLDSEAYKPLIHSTAHMHFGVSEDVRVPCNRVMTPLAFAIFIVKHTYVNSWKILIDKYPEFENYYFGKMKEGCSLLDSEYWQINPETKEFFLG